ncbi:restriction endonuclease subunit S [Rossellomorea vietnamensis]|uniref:restriction endonuclease subunit S n=1 Tax=Rossellomorea vietnamensis TaxID=218284 RepID=UPI000760D23E|nr:restriction endonuclease subunit S [Rossellomorea vietnamensis]
MKIIKYKISELLKFLPKSNIKASEGKLKGEYPFFTSSNKQNKFLDYFEVDCESIIIGTGGNANIHFSKGQFSVSTDCIILQALNRDLINMQYIYYYLRGNIHILENGFRGAGLKHISKKYIGEINIPVPPLEYQLKVVNILNEAKSLIDKRKVQVEVLDQLTQSVFLEMFGDPLRNTKQWTLLEFSDICDTRLGKMLDKKKQKGQNTRPYLANRNVKWGHFILDDLPQMDFLDEELETLSLKKGDLLICEGGEVGRTAIWEWDNKSIYFQKALHRARIKNNLATPEYLQSVMQYFAGNGGFKDFTSKATIAHLTGVKLKRIPIPNPPLNKQQEFTAIVHRIRQEKSLLLTTLRELENLFNSIMQRAFKGELSIQEKILKTK